MKVTANKWVILLSIIIMNLMSALDSSIVNVALPSMMHTLHSDMSAITWVNSIYTISICSTILLFGKIGDEFSKTRIFKLGILLFTIGSLCCALSPTLSILILSRILQALGGSAAMATSQGIISETFPKNQRGRALGLSATFIALGSMLGPTLGGLMISILPWNSLFLINLPVGTFAFIIAYRVLPKKNARHAGIKDYKGIIFMLLSLSFIFISVTLGDLLSYTNVWVALGIVIGIFLLLLFIMIEKHTENPLLSLSIFKNRIFLLSLFCALLSFMGIGAQNIILPFYLEKALKLAPNVAGGLITVIPLVMAVFGPLSGAFSDRFGCESITFVGLITNSIGFLLISFFSLHTAYWQIILTFVILSLGNAMFQSPNNSMIMGSVSFDNLGIASSLGAFIRYAGVTIGIAVFTSLLYGSMSWRLGYTVMDYVEGKDDIFIFAMHIVFISISIVIFIGAIFTLIRMINVRKKAKNKKN